MKFIKNFWQRLKTPSKVAVGAVLGMGFVGGILFWGAFNTGMEATNTEAFCSGCHQPIVEEIQETIHWSNRSGVRAICSDCHVPHDWTGKIVRKVQASKELVAFAMGTISTKEKFYARRKHLAEREWQRLKENDSRECRNCHEFDFMDFSEQGPRSVKMHSTALADGDATCVDCHKGIAHKLPDMKDVEGWQ
ncbi:NapC/NirT family cytochrome c [Paraferrimonas sedimenticola]|uniref:Cytochrome c-type protein n=1 Tax=Paraferrimonas sedimenticola TaxID=375674 RepID=A0AA37VU78_9GAMM|nr:NapC/NirT family cytochrome c [Paraferrimonas sedimenticola]GLP95709.1 cytochrome c-type protein [Paraferrimonas sedimenticola]